MENFVIGILILMSPIVLIIGLIILLKKIESKNTLKFSKTVEKNVDKGIKIFGIIFRLSMLILTTLATIMSFNSVKENEYALFFGILFLIISVLIVIATYNYIKND